MKINICLVEQHAIEGYTNISINNIANIINGSVDEILFKYSDMLQHSQRMEVISLLLSKLKLGGSMTIEIIDPFLLGKHMYNSSMSSKSISEVVTQLNSIIYESDIAQQLQMFPNCTIRNKFNSDLKIVFVIDKN